eukprot:c17209_g1_i2.p1 GENE.c17209_g1_i2~~c17209_g1_i2.p1  ORF type:complete len:409 (+),score=80.82 c17209_g1_i2:53-1279(+)
MPALELFVAGHRIDKEWVRLVLEETDCVSAEILPSPYGQAGLSSGMCLLRTHHAADKPSQEPTTRVRVIKYFGLERLAFSRSLGLAREGVFLYHIWKSAAQDPRLQRLQELIPKIYFALGNMETGAKLVVMECLEGIHTGRLLSPHHPACPEPLADRATFPHTEFEVCAQAFRSAAKLHASFWNDTGILEDWTFLRGRSACGGTSNDRASWENSQELAKKLWSTRHDVQGVTFTDHLSKCIEISLSKIDFENYRRNATDPNSPDYFPWTLVHGDFHPNNLFAARGTDAPKLLDFEMVGLGSGPQDLGQYLISHLHPNSRRTCERELVCDVYYNELAVELAERGHVVPTLEHVWREYKLGGAGRWIWFACVLPSMCPVNLSQYFCDQVAAFVADHFPDDEIENIGMPRV